MSPTPKPYLLWCIAALRQYHDGEIMRDDMNAEPSDICRAYANAARGALVAMIKRRDEDMKTHQVNVVTLLRRLLVLDGALKKEDDFRLARVATRVLVLTADIANDDFVAFDLFDAEDIEDVRRSATSFCRWMCADLLQQDFDEVLLRSGDALCDAETGEFGNAEIL